MAKFQVNNKFRAVTIGGSAGSFTGLTKILTELPADFPLPMFIVVHRLKNVRKGFSETIALKTGKKIIEPTDKELVRNGNIYLAPSNYHMAVDIGFLLSLSTEEMVNDSRPSIDLTLDSVSYIYRNKTIGILLSGANKDGALGMKKINDRGGITIVQDPSECLIDTMPKSAKKLSKIDHTLKVDDITLFLNELHKQY